MNPTQEAVSAEWEKGVACAVEDYGVEEIKDDWQKLQAYIRTLEKEHREMKEALQVFTRFPIDQDDWVRAKHISEKTLSTITL